MNVFLAIYNEHKQRTRHDVYAQGRWSTLAIACDVCLYLDAEKQQLEKAEAIAMAELQAEAMASE